MNYFNFHIGDWERGTRLLSAAEKGVYMDLLTLYYSQEKPIMQMQCKRISRAYSKEEQDAMNFVLENFFAFDGEKYSHGRCDEEILKKNEKSLKRQHAAKCRWNASASDLHANTECKHDAIPITNNQYPINTSTTTSVSDDVAIANEELLELERAKAEAQEKVTDAKSDFVFSQAELEAVAEEKEDKSNPSIPYQEVVDLYNSMCVPGCVKCRMLNANRKTLIRQRTNDLMAYWEGDGSKQDILEGFRRLFKRVSESDFLMGRTPKGQGHENWQVNLAWILKSENFVKLIEGNYR